MTDVVINTTGFFDILKEELKKIPNISGKLGSEEESYEIINNVVRSFILNADQGDSYAPTALHYFWDKEMLHGLRVIKRLDTEYIVNLEKQSKVISKIVSFNRIALVRLRNEILDLVEVSKHSLIFKELSKDYSVVTLSSLKEHIV